MGPEKFLKIVPMDLSNELEYVRDYILMSISSSSRVWLLPMFKSYIKNTQLQFFVQHFLPLASEVQQRSKKYEEEGSLVKAKNFSIVYYQIWDLFPSFCNYPTDVAQVQCLDENLLIYPQSFKLIAKSLGTSLSNEPSLRKTICEGLIHLVEKNRAVASSSWVDSSVHVPITPQEAQQSLSAVAIYAKHFLPILFSIHRIHFSSYYPIYLCFRSCRGKGCSPTHCGCLCFCSRQAGTMLYCRVLSFSRPLTRFLKLW